MTLGPLYEGNEKIMLFIKKNCFWGLMFLTLLKIFFLNLNNWFIQEKKYQYIKITSDVRCKAHQLESDSLFDTRRIFQKLSKVNIIILLLKLVRVLDFIQLIAI